MTAIAPSFSETRIALSREWRLEAAVIEPGVVVVNLRNNGTNAAVQVCHVSESDGGFLVQTQGVNTTKDVLGLVQPTKQDPDEMPIHIAPGDLTQKWMDDAIYRLSRKTRSAVQRWPRNEDSKSLEEWDKDPVWRAILEEAIDLVTVSGIMLT